jgi:hypothetical protein
MRMQPERRREERRARETPPSTRETPGNARETAKPFFQRQGCPVERMSTWEFSDTGLPRSIKRTLPQRKTPS